MAYIEKRVTQSGKTSYRARVRMKGQKTKYKSFLRITDAKMWVTDQESMLRNKVNFPNQQSHKYTVSDMIQRYLVDELPKRRSDKQKFKTHFIPLLRKC